MLSSAHYSSANSSQSVPVLINIVLKRTTDKSKVPFGYSRIWSPEAAVIVYLEAAYIPFINNMCPAPAEDAVGNVMVPPALELVKYSTFVVAAIVAVVALVETTVSAEDPPPLAVTEVVVTPVSLPFASTEITGIAVLLP